MKLNNLTDRIITRLGSSNDSELVTATLAAFKLIFIPIATMSDKKSSEKQKAYAITRDFVTESVALAGYVGITNVVKNNLTAPICKQYYKEQAKKLVSSNKLDINSDSFKLLNNVNFKLLKKNAMGTLKNDDEKAYITNLKEVIKNLGEGIQNPKQLYLNTKKTISHVCVCTLALTIIPFITNKILAIFSNLKEKNNDIAINNVPQLTQKYKQIDMNSYMNTVRKGGYNVLHY